MDYFIGDIIDNEPAEAGRLLCDGSSYNNAEYPVLAPLLVNQPGFDFTQTEVFGTQAIDGNGFACVFGRRDEFVAVGGARQTGSSLVVFERQNLTQVMGVYPGGFVYGLDVSPGGGLLAAAHSGSPFISVFYTGVWTEISGMPVLAGGGRGVNFNSDGSLLAVAHLNAPYFTLLDTSDWSIVAGTPTLGSNGNNALFIKNDEYIVFTTASAPGIEVYRVADWAKMSITGAPTSGIQDVVESPSGDIYFGDSGSVYRLDPTTWTTKQLSPFFSGGVDSIAMHPLGTFLLVTHSSSPYTSILNVHTETVLPTQTEAPSGGDGIAWARAGNEYAWTGGDISSKWFYMWPVDTPAVVGSFFVPLIPGKYPNYPVRIKAT